MRIVAAAARTMRWSMASRGAARGRRERAAVLIELRSATGVVGLGEAAPLPGMSIDSLADAERAAMALIGRVPFEVVDVAAAFALVREAAPAARFAIETALLDALARERGVALHVVLREMIGIEGEVMSVPLAAVVDDVEAARAAVAAGVRCLKVKLGAPGDIERTRAIADAVPGVRLRGDANRSWPAGEVVARLAALAGLPIEYVEEPCVNTRELLRGELGCPIALDESLAGMANEDLTQALGSPELAALVVKPTLLGLSTALELAVRARRAGVAAIVSHGLEGPVGTAACAELALALGGDRAVGLAAHAGLDGWQLAVPQLAADRVHPAGAAGLGFVDLDLTGALSSCVSSAR